MPSLGLWKGILPTMELDRFVAPPRRHESIVPTLALQKDPMKPALDTVTATTAKISRNVDDTLSKKGYTENVEEGRLSSQRGSILRKTAEMQPLAERIEVRRQKDKAASTKAIDRRHNEAILAGSAYQPPEDLPQVLALFSLLSDCKE